jgi:hypothetical protein
MTPPPAAAKPEPKVIENPGMDAVARKKARDAAKERLAKEGVKEPQASEATANEEIPREGDSDWQRVRKLVTEGDTSEYWTLKAAQHLGLVSPEVKRLTDVQPGVLQEIINRWSVVLKAAKEREVA